MSNRWEHERCTEGSGNVDLTIHSSGVGHLYANGIKADLTSRGCAAIESGKKMKLYR